MTHRVRSRGQGGVTLIEMLIVVSILSVAIITFAYGLQTSTTATADAQARQRMHLALESFRSNLSTLVTDGYWRPPPACPDTTVDAQIQAALENDPETANWKAAYAADNLTFRVTAVNYWKGGPAFPVNGVIQPGSFSGTCGAQDQFAQELLLQVTQPTITKPVTGSVVVRKAR